MGKKEIALWCVLADFVALTGYAMFSEGYFAFVDAAFAFASSSIWGAQIVVDFLLALTVALGWCVMDARKRDLAYWPFIVLTLALGSIGPLAYLIHRERVGASAPETAALRAQPQHA